MFNSEVDGMTRSNGVLCPNKYSFTFIESVHSGMLEETREHGENQHCASKLTNTMFRKEGLNTCDE